MGVFSSWQSAVQSAVQTVAQLVGQDIVAKSISLTQAASSVAIQLVSGARLKLGTGTTDYLTSNGTTQISAAGDFAVVGSFLGTTNNGVFLDTAGTKRIFSDGTGILVNGPFSLQADNDLRILSYTDDSATPGNRTVNKVRGKNAFAIGAAAVTITNSFVTANSQVIASLEFADATLNTIRTVIPTAGSFTITGNANATAATKFSWLVLN